MTQLTGATGVSTNPVAFFNQPSGTQSAKSGVAGAFDYVSDAYCGVVLGDITGNGSDEVSLLNNAIFSTSNLSGGGHAKNDYNFALSEGPVFNAHYGSPAADFDGDLVNDVVTEAGIILGRPDLWSNSDLSIALDGVGRIDNAAIGDFDGDGLSEIAVSFSDGGGAPSIVVPSLAH